MKPVLYSIGGVIGALILLKILVLLVEPKLTFFPFRTIDDLPSDRGVPYREHWVETPDGERLSAWYIPAENPVAELLFFHGNAGNLSRGRLDLLLGLNRHGFSVFVFDYRGYGKSTGSPTEEGLFTDTEAATEFFWKRIHQPGHKVIYHGRSLGGLTAARAAAHREPDGLILEATFPDKRTLLRYYPLLLRFLGWFSRYKLSTVSFLKGVKCPVLVIHGDRDRIVPYPVGQELFHTLPATQKELLTLPGVDHDDQATTGRDRYWPCISRFVDRLRHTAKSEADEQRDRTNQGRLVNGTSASDE